MGSVFINYRRGETAGEARALFSDLTAVLGKDSVFMDVDNIAPGRDFRQALHERLETCDLMFALVGKDWASAKKPSGRRRLDDPADFVRLEIAAALKRNIPVTPVLVQGAQMPSVDELPDDIKDFAYRNAFELSHARWESDVREMLKRMGLTGGPVSIGHTTARQSAANATPLADYPVAHHSPSVTKQQTNTARLATFAAVAIVIALAVSGLLYFRDGHEQNASVGRAHPDKLALNREARDAGETEARLAPEKQPFAPREEAPRAAQKDARVIADREGRLPIEREAPLGAAQEKEKARSDAAPEKQPSVRQIERGVATAKKQAAPTSTASSAVTATRPVNGCAEHFVVNRLYKTYHKGPSKSYSGTLEFTRLYPCPSGTCFHGTMTFTGVQQEEKIHGEWSESKFSLKRPGAQHQVWDGTCGATRLAGNWSFPHDKDDHGTFWIAY